MSIKEAMAAFKKAEDNPERFPVEMLGHDVGTATDWFHQELSDGTLMVFFEKFYPRAPSGIFPIGDIAVDYEAGMVYMYEEGKDEIKIDWDHPVDIIEAISKEL